MLGIPVLGICYGYHVIIKHFGGEIGKERIREDGQFEVTLDTSCDLFEGLEKTQNVLLTHGDFVKMVQQIIVQVFITLFYSYLIVCYQWVGLVI